MLPKNYQTEDNMNEAETKNTPKKKKKMPKWLKVILILILVAAVVLAAGVALSFFGVFKMIFGGAAAANASTYSYYTVSTRDITTTLTGTGTLQPYDAYTITATVTGDILSADFEEMQEVNEDDVLYVVDSSDIEDDIEDKKEDVADALEDLNDIEDDYEDLKLVSDYSGTVRELYVEEGDNAANGGKIAYIVDNETMLLEIPFFASNTDYINNGSPATVTFSANGETLAGTVCEISNLTSVNSNNSIIRNITISVENPGGITFGMQAYASAVGINGMVYDCSGLGTFKYNEEETVTASASGEIEHLYIEEGDRVEKGQLIGTISSENLDKQKEQLEKAYDAQKKALDDLNERLEDYTITAPISGTIVQKNYKALDTIGQSSMSSTTSLAIIYDMSKLTFDLAIDELDLSLIEVGQKVKITSDSIDNMEFEGIVSKKSIVGTSSGGTTVYPVTVDIEGNDVLLPGMNVNAEIVISSTGNVLAVPVSAVSRGNKIEILKGVLPETAGGRPQGMLLTKPETEAVDVELGASDGDYIEIKAGLAEGDIIIYQVRNITQDAMSAMMNMMGGMGGGMSGGNMGGQRPSGNMSGGNFGGSQRPSGNMGGNFGGR